MIYIIIGIAVKLAISILLTLQKSIRIGKYNKPLEKYRVAQKDNLPKIFTPN